jgi:hypothetical protein
VSRLFVGIDASLNHCGVVVLDDNFFHDYYYVAKRKKDIKKLGHGTRLPNFRSSGKNKREKILAEHMRLHWWQRWWSTTLDHIREPKPGSYPDVYIGLEGYAYRAAQNAHQLGEIGGVVRFEATCLGNVHLRLHDPTSPKTFATDKGNASKELVISHVCDEVHDFSVDHEGDILGDLCDAMTLARMVRTEVKIRDGDVTLKSLPNKERRIFNRTTTTYPVNILERPWITLEACEELLE